MSRQKAPVIPLLGPSSKTQPYAATTARSFGVGGDKPELPPRNPPRNIKTARATSSRTSCGSVSRAEAEGSTHAKLKDREIPRSGVTKARDSSARANDYKHTLKQNDTQRLVSASDLELLVTGKPLSLKEFSKGKSVRDLPCLVKVVDGHSSLCEYYSFSKEQMFVVLEKKSMPVVTCKGQVDGSSYAVPLNTTAFHLVPYWMDTELVRPNSFGKITANELLQSKALPPVLAVSVEFEVGEHHSKKTVPVGTLLFPNEKKRSKDQRQSVLHAKSKSGEMVQITPDCKGRFSILACDVRLSLQQAITHLKVPFSMRTVSDCDSLYVSAITAEKVHKEDVFIGMMKSTDGTSLDDIAAFSRIVEIPVGFNLTVVTMVPKQKEILGQIYDFVLAEYSGTKQRPVRSPSKPSNRVIMAPNPAYITFMPTNHEKKANFTNHEKAKFSARPTSSVRANVATPPYRVATPPYREEHIYDVVDNYRARPTAANLQMPSLDAKVAGTPLNSSQSSSDAATAVEYYEDMPTVADQVASPDSKVEETQIEGTQPSSDAAAAVEYYEEMPTVADQVVSPDPKVEETPIEGAQPSSDATAAVEYYEEMPTVADQVVSPDPKVEETPLEGAQPSSDAAAAVEDYEVMLPAADQVVSPDSNVEESPIEGAQPSSDSTAAVEDYEVMLPAADQVVSACPKLKVEETPIEGAQPSSDAADIDYYEGLPTAATQQTMPPDSEAAGTVFDREQSPSEKNVSTSVTQGGCVEETVANIAYLKKMQNGEILHLLDAMNLSAYKEAFEQEQIDGETMVCLSADMLIELGVSKSLHRLRLMKIISGQTSASSFINFP